MDIIDKVLYEYKEQHEREDVLEAYRVLFKDSIAVKIVLQDLMRKSNYATTSVCLDSNAQYHMLGMQMVIKTIKDSINTPILENSMLPADVNGNVEEGE